MMTEGSIKSGVATFWGIPTSQIELTELGTTGGEDPRTYFVVWN
jgi:hypothetical protein